MRSGQLSSNVGDSSEPWHLRQEEGELGWSIVPPGWILNYDPKFDASIELVGTFGSSKEDLVMMLLRRTMGRFSVWASIWMTDATNELL
ncbi:hypothetical protein CLAFUW4_10938 [Fulvia fulva]|uniref:Uncharacterized protein n=1 Tax=Passalora fulva TaxID=5499 RepID=A0A9Q8PBU6_PASFU|nr:uncharacterized protein CLAFUR5_09980 [Fulvia fulva]KAK4620139.1 hypothetical protein CLAFUR4_10943 [Fulvia fulva]KAK4620908.1 hypothetical protein CLAFUR0_10950 [Fulvia fulva]UJO19612.1 hypothetical protein CLAFUR5_09980 [Fulvia fulva]WPV17399.1 hypothetical protein CLAFUW4_10938 [Fulvia fulva]WPV32442.1 hypothetical protein CLAFUW7_10936 [Fulvia fulva]